DATAPPRPPTVWPALPMPPPPESRVKRQVSQTTGKVRTNCLETGHGRAHGEPQAFRCAAGATAVGDGLGGTGGGMKVLMSEQSSARMLRDRVMEAEAILEQGCRSVGASQIASRAYTDWHEQRDADLDDAQHGRETPDAHEPVDPAHQ